MINQFIKNERGEVVLATVALISLLGIGIAKGVDAVTPVSDVCTVTLQEQYNGQLLTRVKTIQCPKEIK